MTTINNQETKRKVWTAAEEQALKLDYQTLEPEQLATKYGTTYHAIKLKAHKLGIKREETKLYDEEQIVKDHAELSLKDLLAKHNIPTTQLYRILNKHSVVCRKLTDFGDEEVFKTRYQSLPSEELELLYNTSYTNIKSKAANMGIQRPKELIKYKEGHLALTDDLIVKLYVEEKLSSSEIAERCGIKSGHWIREILIDNGVIMRPSTEANRTYDLDETFFETIDTEEKAYFLGWLASDGCVSTKGYCISLSIIKTDIEIITAFKKALKTEAPVKTVEFHTCNSKPQAALRINSVKMKNDLAKHNIVPQKSLILQFPTTVPDNLMHHYIRGFMDGDGSVRCDKTNHHHDNVNFTSTKEFLEGLAAKVQQLAGIDSTGMYQCNTGKNTWRLFYKGSKRVLPMYDFLYKDANLWLTRKYNNYQDILTNCNKYRVNSIFLSKKDWDGWSLHKIAMLKFKVFNYYRDFGFPYIKMPLEQRLHKFNIVKNYDTTNAIVDKIVAVHDSNFLPDYYFPHMYEVKCNDLPSTMEVFLDDKMLKNAIDSRIKFADNIADNTIRRGLKYLGQAVCNFKPKTAKAIYEHFAGPDAVVWDMSAGWGGRMIGALASNNVAKYIGTDPNTKNTAGYETIISDFKESSKCLIEMHCRGSEEYLPEENSLDLCFTSPPYFTTEKYSSEATQSCNKYPTQEAWLNGFLKKTFENCYLGLKPGKHMLINIANVEVYPGLEADTVKVAEQCGFKLVDTLQYRMGLSMFLKDGEAGKKHRHEPIFVFQKPTLSPLQNNPITVP